MVSVHPTALVDPEAELGAGVTIGPYSVIEAGARLGEGCTVGAHVQIHGRTSLGPHCIVDKGAAIGGDPQDLRSTATATFLEIGARNTFREYVTIHRSTREGEATRIGDNNLLMAFSHIGHDCVVGDNTIMANMTTVGGHCQIDDGAVIGGMTAIHQKVRVGRLVMVRGMSGLNQDVPPYALVGGAPAKVLGINVIGLRRNGVSAAAREAIKTAVRELYLSGRNRLQALEELRATLPDLPEVAELLDFALAMREGRNGRQLER